LRCRGVCGSGYRILTTAARRLSGNRERETRVELRARRASEEKDSNSYSNANTNSYRNCNSNSNCDSNADCNRNSNSAVAIANGDSNIYSDANGDIHSDTNSNKHAGCNPNCNGNPDCNGTDSASRGLLHNRHRHPALEHGLRQP
jgi:hypothetical protein